MARYDFRCSKGHVTEHECPMVDVPPSLTCSHGAKRACGRTAERVFAAPTVQFHGRSSFTNAVSGRRRRKNAADDLYRPHDPFADAFAR